MKGLKKTITVSIQRHLSSSFLSLQFSSYNVSLFLLSGDFVSFSFHIILKTAREGCSLNFDVEGSVQVYAG